jgi:hypothetical protein
MLMCKLYSFIDTEQPLNPLLASFFSKILHTLLRRTSYQVHYLDDHYYLYLRKIRL